MKVNSIVNNICKNKTIKKGLEFAADNGTLFAAGTSLAMSTIIRPFSILVTPKTEKENKKLACAKSISSSAIGFLFLLVASLPMSKGIKNINKNPSKYLNKKTIENLKETKKTLQESKGYQCATQMFKLGLGFFIAAPKAFLTSALTPEINKILPQNNKKNDISFKGKSDLISKNIGKMINKPFTQKIVDKIKDTNYQMNIPVLTDIVATTTFVQQIKKNKNIEENRKKILNNNAVISTALCIAGSYGVDRALNKPTDKFIKKFAEINKNSTKLSKYIEGIRIVKPTLILGLMYYAVIPVISTFFAERINQPNKK